MCVCVCVCVCDARYRHVRDDVTWYAMCRVPCCHVVYCWCVRMTGCVRAQRGVQLLLGYFSNMLRSRNTYT